MSNNSVRSVDNYKRQLAKVGLELDENNLVNSSISIVDYLKSTNFTGLIYVIGSGEMRKRLQSEGFEIIYGVNYDRNIDFQLKLNATTSF